MRAAFTTAGEAEGAELTAEPDDQMGVFIHQLLERELNNLFQREPREHIAIRSVFSTLRIMGPQLGFPHSSAVRGTQGAALRELRPRRGHSRYRVLYQRRVDHCVLLALAPEATRDPRGFRSAIDTAIERATWIPEQKAD